MFALFEKISQVIIRQAIKAGGHRGVVFVLHIGIAISVTLSLGPLALSAALSGAEEISVVANATNATQGTRASSLEESNTKKSAQNTAATTDKDPKDPKDSNAPVAKNASEQTPGAEAERTFYNDPFATRSQDNAPSFTMLWLRLMGVLLLLAFIAYMLLRWTKRKRQLQSQAHPLYKEIASFPLEMNKSVKIIKVIQDYYVLTITQEGVTLLRHLDDKVSLDEVKLYEDDASLTDGGGPLFGELFQKYFISPQQRARTAKSQNPFNITGRLRDKVKKI